MTNSKNQPGRKTHSVIRRMLKILFGVVVVLAILFAVKRTGDFFILRSIRAPLPPAPLHVSRQPAENLASCHVEKFTFESSPGDVVPVMAAIPAKSGRRYPAVIFLYGIGMKMQFNDEIAAAVTHAGFALFIPEQYGRGERRQEKRSNWKDFLAVRQRIVLTIEETRRLVDVLAERPDIDPQRIYLWGASFGAMVGCSAMAYEPRLKGMVLTLAAGDLQRLVADSPFRQQQPFFSWINIAAPLAAEILRPFDPVLHVGRIAPRPLLFQNAEQDELLPRSAVEALYHAAGQPKSIRWYDTPHNSPQRAALERAIRDGLVWLQEQDRLPGVAAALPK